MSDASVKAPWHVWLVGVFALLFNAIGVFDFVMNLWQGPAYLASAGMTPEQIAHYRGMPAWMMVVWACAVLGAVRPAALPDPGHRRARALRRGAHSPSPRRAVRAPPGGGGAFTGAVVALRLVLFAWYARAMATRSVLR